MIFGEKWDLLSELQALLALDFLWWKKVFIFWFFFRWFNSSGDHLIFKPRREGENVARPCANCDRKETELVSDGLFLTSVDLIGPLVVSSRTGECFMKILAGCGLLRTRWLATRWLASLRSAHSKKYIYFPKKSLKKYEKGAAKGFRPPSWAI